MGSKAVAEELAHLADFQTVLEFASRTKEETNKLIQVEEQELAGINARLSQIQKDVQAQRAVIDQYDDILLVTEEKAAGAVCSGSIPEDQRKGNRPAETG